MTGERPIPVTTPETMKAASEALDRLFEFPAWDQTPENYLELSRVVSVEDDGDETDGPDDDPQDGATA